MADTNFTPQEIEEFLQQFFDVVGARQYVGARYVPIFGRVGEDTVEWDDGAPYEPLTVVMHLGVSYVSRRYVPTGIQITDTAYWVETYRFNAQVEQYRQQVLAFSDRIDGAYEAVDGLRDEVADEYIPFPDPDSHPKYGDAGQVLETQGDGSVVWVDPVTVTPEVAGPLIDAWLDDHPEATTTVQDGAVTTAKLADGAVTDAKLAANGILAKAATLENDIALPYDQATAYPAGTYLIINGRLSRLNDAHEAGAALGSYNYVNAGGEIYRLAAQNFASIYDKTKAYNVGEFCMYNNLLYTCVTAIGSGGEAWDASHWSRVYVTKEFRDVRMIAMNQQLMANLNPFDTERWEYVGGISYENGTLTINGPWYIYNYPIRQIAAGSSLSVAVSGGKFVYLTFDALGVLQLRCEGAGSETFRNDNAKTVIGYIDNALNLHILHPSLQLDAFKQSTTASIDDIDGRFESVTPTNVTTTKSNVDQISGGTLVDDTATTPISSDTRTLWIGGRSESYGACLGRTVRFTAKLALTNMTRADLLPYIAVASGNEQIEDYEYEITNESVTYTFDLPADYTGNYILVGVRFHASSTVQRSIRFYEGTMSVYRDTTEVLDSERVIPQEGKKLYCIGDSYTHMSTWQSTVEYELGLSGWKQEAVSGGTLVANYQDVEGVDTDSDIVTVFYGTNDWYTNRAIGTISDMAAPPATPTFMGAYNYVCDWLSENVPQAQVVLVTHSQRFDANAVAMGTANGYSDNGYPKNDNGDTLEDFCEAIKEVGAKWGYPVCDLTHNSGINENTATYYYNSDLLHPNRDKGGPRIGHIIAQVIAANTD